MSYQLLKEDVLFYQRFLKSIGYYQGLLDGYWGPVTAKADDQFVAESQRIADKYGRFDPRTESSINTLVPAAQVVARQFMKAGVKKTDVRILSGTRTYSEQNALYAHGRFGNKSPVITKAKGGQSNHNFGIAWDIGLFDKKGIYLGNDAPYADFAAFIMAKIPNIEWGGNWVSFRDMPHYQLPSVSDSVAVVRRLFEKGKPYIVA